MPIILLSPTYISSHQSLIPVNKLPPQKVIPCSHSDVHQQLLVYFAKPQSSATPRQGQSAARV